MAVLVGQQAPNFTASAVVNGGEIVSDFSLEQFRGKYVVLFFYPKDFTFVCPTELFAFQEKLKDFKLEWHDSKSLCVVLCSNGYPDKYEKNIEIQNFNSVVLDEKNFLFHAGTIKKEDKIIAIGGRVLNFISISNDYYDAREKIHQNLEKLNWKAGFYRKDIAYKVINK